ncbi:protein of unknown function [Tepidibacter aestuarii]|nr:protein of unknown function [Tepidibacter aestuarii]
MSLIGKCGNKMYKKNPFFLLYINIQYGCNIKNLILKIMGFIKN